jgi:hypothetical protein
MKTMNKDSKVNEILVEDVRLTKIENGEVTILDAKSAAELDKAKAKIVLKLAVMEEMFASGELVLSEKPGSVIPFDTVERAIGGGM